MANNVSATTLPEWTVFDLKRSIESAEPPRIIDVRDPEEFAVCRIPGAELIPLQELPGRMAEIDPDVPTVLLCKMGGRSFQAGMFLKQNGFQNVFNLAGGMVAWAEHIDPSLPRYW